MFNDMDKEELEGIGEIAEEMINKNEGQNQKGGIGEILSKGTNIFGNMDKAKSIAIKFIKIHLYFIIDEYDDIPEKQEKRIKDLLSDLKEL